jgi:hypothetical protein
MWWGQSAEFEQPRVGGARQIRRARRALKVRLQPGPVLTILVAGLLVCPLARAQRGSHGSAPVAARPGSSAVVGPHAGRVRTAASNQATVRVFAASSVSRPPWQDRPIPSGSKLPPVRNPSPRNPVRTTGYYLLYGGGTYWGPTNGDEASDQATVDQVDADETGGDQSLDQSSRNQSRNANAVTLQSQEAQSAEEDSYAPQTAADQEAQAPLPDEGEFTLVLNDGRWIQAVAFTHSNDRIVYITTAGSRYTIAANELDSDSTLRVNQERGTPLQSPL